MRTFLKAARARLADGDRDGAAEAVRKASSYLDHVATRRAIPKARANRLKSRLNRQLAAL